MPPVETETMTQPETTEETELTPLQILTREFEDCPAEGTLEVWKQQFGTIHAFTPDAETVVIFRPLRRLEHKNITRDMRQLSETQAAQMNPAMVEEHLHEKVVTACVLHPTVTVEMFNTSAAGLIPTLFNLVMENSKFIAPERALANCFKL